MFSLFSLDLDTALANHHINKQTMACASPCTSLQGNELVGSLGGLGDRGAALQDALGHWLLGMAAQTHREGAAFRVKPWMQQRGAHGGAVKWGSALQTEQCPPLLLPSFSSGFEKGDGVQHLQKKHLSREGSSKAETCGQLFGEPT